MASADPLSQVVSDQVNSNAYLMCQTSVFSSKSFGQKENIKEISKLANEYGTEFVNVFYKTLDSKRHVRLLTSFNLASKS